MYTPPRCGFIRGGYKAGPPQLQRFSPSISRKGGGCQEPDQKHAAENTRRNVRARLPPAAMGRRRVRSRLRAASVSARNWMAAFLLPVSRRLHRAVCGRQERAVLSRADIVPGMERHTPPNPPHRAVAPG